VLECEVRLDEMFPLLVDLRNGAKSAVALMNRYRALQDLEREGKLLDHIGDEKVEKILRKNLLISPISVIIQEYEDDGYTLEELSSKYSYGKKNAFWDIYIGRKSVECIRKLYDKLNDN
jgi:hypothetical protein